MDLKTIGLKKLREIDLLNDEINLIEQKKQRIYLEISNLKKSMQAENKHYIGRKSRTLTDKGLEVISNCDFVSVGDNFELIFHFKNDKSNGKLYFSSWL